MLTSSIVWVIGREMPSSQPSTEILSINLLFMLLVEKPKRQIHLLI